MSSRLFALTETGFFTPTEFYTRAASNPKVKPRLKKKAEKIVANWAYLASRGKRALEAARLGELTFEFWKAQRKEMRSLDLGYTTRYVYRDGLKAAYRSTLEYYDFQM